ncbi:MAG: restriction endonuclease subunit S [Chloroflexia bacterium]|nr:restriction endonuclease subunit S [Chloroflexia bacterium]
MHCRHHVNQASINTSFLSTKTHIPLPPLPEQRRIVAEIETQFSRLDAGVAALERTRRALERYRASVLQAACAGRLVPTEAALAQAEGREYEPAGALIERILAERRARWEEQRWQYEIERAQKKAAQAERRAAGRPHHIRDLEPQDWQQRPPEEYAPYLPKGDRWKRKYDEPQPPSTDELPALPAGWVWATVGQLAAHEANAITDGPFGSKLKTSHYTETGPRVIRLQNIGDGKFKDEKAHISQEHFESLRKHEIFANDLLIAALGNSLPRACIIPEFVGPAIVKADCIRFKPHPEIGNFKYLNAALNSELLTRIAASIVHGVGRPRLNQQEVKSLPIPLPPLSEQHRIVEEVERRLSVVEALEAAVGANLRRAERLRQAILKRAFEGRLAPQDPADEPAAALLQRIRNDRNDD